MPLAIVRGFAFIVSIVMAVREFKMLKRAFVETLRQRLITAH